MFSTTLERYVGGHIVDRAEDGSEVEVEVRFLPEGEDQTRVELEHRDLDRHGPGWESVRDGVDADQGWPLYLARYADLFSNS